MTVFHGRASYHKRSANSRSRKKSAHNAGRQPEYKILRRRSIATKTKLCLECGTTKPLTDFSKSGRVGSRTEENTNDTCKQCFLARAAAYVAAKRLTYNALVQRNRAALTAPYDPVPLARLRLRHWPFWQQTRWTPQDQGDLGTLCAAAVPIEECADILGRAPTSIAWRARDLRLEMPQEWAKLIAPKRVIKPRVPRFILKYPYLAKARPSDADLLRVNDLVPRHYPDWMRADIAQSVLLAFFEGEVSIVELEGHKGDMRWFYKKYYREQEPREEVRIAPQSESDNRSYDEISMARKGYQSLERHEEANQIEYVWERERKAARFLMAGKVTNLRDVDAMLVNGEIKIADLRLELFRPWDRIRKHARQQLRERFGVELDRTQAENLIEFCRNRSPDDRDRQRELHVLVGRKDRLPIIYDRSANEIVTFLPRGTEQMGQR